MTDNKSGKNKARTTRSGKGPAARKSADNAIPEAHPQMPMDQDPLLVGLL